jgi:RNA-directed DNA polymerase
MRPVFLGEESRVRVMGPVLGIAVVLGCLIAMPASVVWAAVAASRWLARNVGSGVLPIAGGLGVAVLVIAAWVFLFKLVLTGFETRMALGRRPLRSLRARFGIGLGIPELARRLAINENELRTHSPRYEQVTLKKRSGGVRVLDVPDDQTKALQRRILRLLLARLKAHPAAHAYERKRSIATNAARHVKQQVIVKMDIVDFFNRTGSDRVERYFRAIGWSREAAQCLTRVVTYNGGLPQGAPTSPRLANLVNIGLDHAITKRASRLHGTYTRYADDITISFPEDWPSRMRGIIYQVRALAKAHGYRLHGRPKLGTYRRHQRQQVCGVVVNDKLSLPRALRRRLRAIRHRLSQGRDASLTAAQLDGWSAYEKMITVPAAARTWKPRLRRRGTDRHLDE